MPPKKKCRGPKLTTVQEERADSSSESDSERDYDGDDFDNELDDVQAPASDARRQKEPAVPEGIAGSVVITTEKRMRKAVIEAIRLTFQSRSNINQDISISTQKILRAHNKSRNHKNAVAVEEAMLNEIDIRLCMMLEEITVVEHRARVFKMISLTACELLKQGSDTLLQFLLKFLDKWGKSTSLAARVNTASFVAYLFETGSKELEQADDKFCGYSLTDSKKLYVFLKRALRDKEYHARVPAIRGMAFLQTTPIPSLWCTDGQENTPREFLIRSFRDTAWECRLVAMQSMNPKDGDAEMLAEIVKFDKCTKVRMAALYQFGSLKPNRFVREKIEMIDLCFKDHDVEMRDMAKEVIRSWVRKLSERWTVNQKPKEVDDIIETDDIGNRLETVEAKAKGFILSGQALALLWLNEVVETPESHSILRRIIMHLLDVIRSMYMCHQEPISTFADMIMNDLREKMMQRAIPIITKSTIGSVLEESDAVETQDAETSRAMIFFWRCLIEYVVDRRRGEADKVNALMRFMSPLKTMVENFIRLLHRVKDLEETSGKDPDELYVVQMSIVENFLWVMRHTTHDQAGLDAYKQLLISLLMNLCYQKKVVDMIVCELAQFYHDCPDDLLSMLYAKFNEMRMNFKGDEFPQLEEAVLVGEQYIRLHHGDEHSTRPDGQFMISRSKAMELVDFYHMMVVNAVMKTGLLKEWSDEDDARYTPGFVRHSKSSNLDACVISVECIGISAMYDLERARSALSDLYNNFFHYRKEVQKVLLTILVDLTVQYGLEEVNCFDPTDRKHNEPHSVINVFTKIIMDDKADKKDESIVLMAAVEGLGKIFLQIKERDTDGPWQRAMTALLFRASYLINSRFSAKVRSTIIVILQFFCGLTNTNQRLVIQCFRPFFGMWATSTNTELLTDEPGEAVAKLKRFAATFVALTRHSLLPADEQKKPPVHIELVDEILGELAGAPDSAVVDYFMFALHCIEFESFPRDPLQKIYADLESYVGLHEEDTDRHRYNELRRVRKKIAKILGFNERDDEYEVPAKSSDSRTRKTVEEGEDEDVIEEEDEAGPSKGRKPRAPKTATASAQKKRKETPSALDIIQSPQRNPKKPSSRPGTATRAPAPVARAAPPRSARKLQK